MRRRIAHWGGWSRNFGDLAIQAGMQFSLQDVTDDFLEFLPISSDLPLDNSRAPELGRETVRMINQTCDMLIVGGGGQIMQRKEGETKSGWQFNIEESVLDELEVPLIVYSIGFNEFPHEDGKFTYHTRKHIKKTYEKSYFFSVRNTGTQDKLIEWGLTNTKVIADPAIWCPSADIRLSSDPEILIGLNWAGDRIEKRFEGDSWKIAINNMCDGISRFIDRSGQNAKVIYIPHLERYDLEHYPLFEKRLGPVLINLSDMFPYLYPEALVNAPVFAGVYKALDVVLGVRGHSNIIPFGQGTSFIGFGDHVKNKFFAKDVGGVVAKNDSLEIAEALNMAVFNKDYNSGLKSNLYLLKEQSRSYNKELMTLGFKR